MSAIIELKNVSKSFGGITALKKASIKVDVGEVVGLIGDNGAGKSTLIKTLVGVHAPDDGQIIIRGKEVKLIRGDILIFPSNFIYPHEVKDITKGIRYSFVSWAF